MRIRWMEEEYRYRVHEIYQQGIEDGNATFETMIREELWWIGMLQAERFVLVHEEHVVGWGKLSRVSEREVYSGVREISIYVDRSFRGNGGGRCILAAMIQYADTHGIWTLQLHLFPENVASRRLHERFGFELVGRRRAIARHHGVWRDTLLFERRNSVR